MQADYSSENQPVTFTQRPTKDGAVVAHQQAAKREPFSNIDTNNSPLTKVIRKKSSSPVKPLKVAKLPAE